MFVPFVLPPPLPSPPARPPARIGTVKTVQGMKTWPSRAELLKHFQEVCEEPAAAFFGWRLRGREKTADRGGASRNKHYVLQRKRRFVGSFVLFVCLFVCVFVCLFVCLLVGWLVGLFVCWFVGCRFLFGLLILEHEGLVGDLFFGAPYQPCREIESLASLFLGFCEKVHGQNS